MIKILDNPLGEVVGNISYFHTITFNGADVNEIRVNNRDVIALSGLIPSIITNLKARGCDAIIDIYNQYPEILNTLNGEHSILFDGNSYFDTGCTPVTTDIVESKFELVEKQSSYQTLFCTRNGSKASFTAFITNTGNNIRADFGDTYGSNIFTLQLGILYKFTMKSGLAELDDGQSRTISSATIYPSSPFVIGASYESYKKLTSASNKMNQTKYNSFAVMNSDEMYKLYLIPLETNKFIDLVSGKIITNKGTGTATFI